MTDEEIKAKLLSGIDDGDIITSEKKTELGECFSVEMENNFDNRHWRVMDYKRKTGVRVMDLYEEDSGNFKVSM